MMQERETDLSDSFSKSTSGKVIIDPELRAKLNGLNEQLEVLDEGGQTLGHFVPEAMYRKMIYALAEAACPFSKEEIERRRHETGGRSLAEIWNRLGV